MLRLALAAMHVCCDSSARCLLRMTCGLMLLAPGGACGGASRAEAADARPPNLVYIMADNK